MSGHSHWAGIKHKKGRVDAKRGKLFSKLARQIIVAARSGGGDLDMNLALRYAIDNARAANMNKDGIERAIKKGTGESGGESYEEIMYEGYAPSGVAIMAQALTDNHRRTAGEIRKIFEVRGGNLGQSNCVAYLFDRTGFIAISTDADDEDSLMELALEHGAENFETAGELYEITVSVGDFDGLKKAIKEKGITVETAEITYLPKTRVPIDEEAARKVLKFIDNLEDHDDIQNVYSNYDISDEIFARLAAEED
ncbi:MAG: YebC/PmpR family DNA-binding transcriptional regulator [Planctomycetota bacterium]